MISISKQLRRVGLVAVALGSIGLSGQAFAQNTLSGTPIVNTATVNYSVSSIAQTPVTAAATFVVDTAINLNVTDTGTTQTLVTPGQPNALTVFTLTNTSNIASSFTFAATQPTTDGFDMYPQGGSATGNLNVYVDANANGTYEPLTDTQSTIPSLGRNLSIAVFVLGDTPIGTANGLIAQVRLTATARDTAAGNPAWVTTPGADTAMGVQIVVRNSTAFDDDEYLVQSAALAVAKSSSVIWDPLNLFSVNAKAIPTAIMEYAISLTNTGTVSATLVSISDPIPTNTTFSATNPYNAGASNVSITVGVAAPTFCLAEAGGTDSNSDGCVRTAGGTLTVGAPALSTIASGGTPVVVRFRVTIN
jgi:hypothetical protein